MDKAVIANIVRSVEPIPTEATCQQRAHCGAIVLDWLGAPCTVIQGALLANIGGRIVAFHGADNRGCYGESFFHAHVWLEAEGNIIDFSAHDWSAGLLPYIWQPREALTRSWQPSGSPAVGEIWYGPFDGERIQYGLTATAVAAEQQLREAFDCARLLPCKRPSTSSADNDIGQPKIAQPLRPPLQLVESKIGSLKDPIPPSRRHPSLSPNLLNRTSP